MTTNGDEPQRKRRIFRLVSPRKIGGWAGRRFGWDPRPGRESALVRGWNFTVGSAARAADAMRPRTLPVSRLFDPPPAARREAFENMLRSMDPADVRRKVRQLRFQALVCAVIAIAGPPGLFLAAPAGRLFDAVMTVAASMTVFIVALVVSLSTAYRAWQLSRQRFGTFMEFAAGLPRSFFQT